MMRREVEISGRMRALAKLVTPGRIVCDVGCDHGFVSIYLVQKHIAENVVAMDVRKGPLSQAQAHIAEWGLEDRIQTRISDGLQHLKVGEADCMLCAGMGGPLMIKILQEGREKALAMKELVLQPQSELAMFRAYLRTNGYHIIEEDMVFEDGKYYPMMKAVPEHAEEKSEGEEYLTELEDHFGPRLLAQKHPVLRQYLEYSERIALDLIERLKGQNGERALGRLPELEGEVKRIREALEYYKR